MLANLPFAIRSLGQDIHNKLGSVANSFN